MFDVSSFVRVLAFAAFYAGVEWRYVNRKEKEWTKKIEGFREKPVFWVISPYHLYILLPIFIIVSYSPSLSAWAGNTFLLAVVEDIIYFFWRRSPITEKDWTTTLMGSFGILGTRIPLWWPLDTVVAVALYLVP